MPKSYEEATEERAAEDLGDPEPEPEYDPNLNTRSVEEVFGDVKDRVENVPDWLTPDGDSGPGDIPPVGGGRGEIGVDIDLDELDSLDNSGLLQVIARVNIAQLSAMFDIASAVEPFSTITVSGVNAIQDADVPEPVVPQSDQTKIPTRTLFMRASTDNDAPIYIGDDEVEPQSGLVLYPGEFYAMESDLRADEFWMASSEEGEVIQLLGLV